MLANASCICPSLPSNCKARSCNHHTQVEIKRRKPTRKRFATLGSAGCPPASAAATVPASGDTSGPAPMDVEQDLEGWRTTFRLPQLNFASMNTRHAEIRVWSACKEELTSSLCLLDDRFARKSQYSKEVRWTLARLRSPQALVPASPEFEQISESTRAHP